MSVVQALETVLRGEIVVSTAHERAHSRASVPPADRTSGMPS